jgi:hypothetical protein
MRINRGFVLVFVGLVLLTCFAAEAKDESGSKTVVVKCDKGDSINEALKEKADILIIEVQGWCTEDVVIERDFVTLRGTDPFIDGIEAAELETSLGVSVSIRGAQQVLLDGLGINGGDTALSVNDSWGVDVVDCRLEGGDTWVVWVVGSRIVLAGGTVITNHLNGLRAFQGNSRVICEGCMIDVPNGWAVRASSGSRIDLEFSTVNGTLRTDAGGILIVEDTEVTGAEGEEGLRCEGKVEWQGGELDGAINIDEGGWAELANVTQTSLGGDSHNRVQYNSTLILSKSTRVGDTHFSDFSNGRVTNSILGDLICSRGADVWCDGNVTKLSSNCGLCP